MLEYVLKNEKIHPYCKKMKKEILEFEFKVKDNKIEYVFPNSTICQGLRKAETIEKALSYADDRILNQIKKDDCLIIEGDKIFFKFNHTMMVKIQNALKMEGGAFEPDNLHSILEVVQEVHKNLDKKLVSRTEME